MFSELLHIYPDLPDFLNVQNARVKITYIFLILPSIYKGVQCRIQCLNSTSVLKRKKSPGISGLMTHYLKKYYPNILHEESIERNENLYPLKRKLTWRDMITIFRCLKGL